MRRFLRKVLLLFDLVAQLVEQYTFNVWALGSSPSQITKRPQVGRFLFIPLSTSFSFFTKVILYNMHTGIYMELLFFGLNLTSQTENTKNGMVEIKILR